MPGSVAGLMLRCFVNIRTDADFTAKFCTRRYGRGDFVVASAASGKLWEKLMKFVCRVLRKALGRFNETLRKFGTVLTEIEAVISSLPQIYSI